jgi:hypothetical protein
VGILLFLAKPLFYLASLAVASVIFKSHGPHWKMPPWLVVVLATIARLLVGGVSAAIVVSITISVDEPGFLFIPMLAAFGFVFWLATARIAFRRAPLGKLVAFAAIAEAMSATIDALALHDFSGIRFC